MTENHPKNSRAWALLETKSIDEEHRIVRGIATTPSTDRVGDQVMPRGATIPDHLPVLSQHDQDAPIGHMFKHRVTPTGIEVEIQIAKDTGLGYVEKAWKQIKSGLVRGLSIGFRGTEVEALKDGGLKFIKWDWLELSAVTIPANAEATITAVKKFDVERKSADGDPPAMSEGDQAASGTDKLKRARHAIIGAKRAIRGK